MQKLQGKTRRKLTDLELEEDEIKRKIRGLDEE